MHDIALTTSCVELPKVLYIYDAIVTSDRAAECFLSLITRPTGASVLFIANKVISLIVSAMEMRGFASFPSDEASVPISPASMGVSADYDTEVRVPRYTLQRMVCSWYPLVAALHSR